MYSDYTSHTTVKTLVGIAPRGGFTFISNTYPGSISDKEIVVKCGFLNPNLWKQDDIVMTDQGFLIGDYLKPLGIGLEIPNFLKGQGQFTIKETVKKSANCKWKNACGKNHTTFEILSYTWQVIAN